MVSRGEGGAMSGSGRGLLLSRSRLSVWRRSARLASPPGGLWRPREALPVPGRPFLARPAARRPVARPTSP